MDLSTVLGMIVSWGFVVMAILLGVGLGAYIDVQSLLIVFGSSMGALAMCYPLEEVMTLGGVMGKAFFIKPESKIETVKNLVQYSMIARKEGILGLEESIENMDNEFMRKGLQLAVDGTDPEIMREIMEKELGAVEERHGVGISMIAALVSLCPAFGMVGTLIGLVGMLKTMEDPSTIGVSMAVALITTLYGALAANGIFLPIQIKLRFRNDEEISLKKVMIEGILSIQQGDNTRVLEDKLKVLIAPAKRDLVNQE